MFYLRIMSLDGLRTKSVEGPYDTWDDASEAEDDMNFDYELFEVKIIEEEDEE